MNIKDKLRQIEASRPGKPALPAAPPLQPDFVTPLVDVIDGTIREAASGSFFYCGRDLPAGYQHGSVALNSRSARPGLLARIGKNKALEGLQPEQVLFIDTETSGISGGTGMFAFLIGIGYFKKDNVFRIEQFFMNDFNEELPLLQELNRIISDHQAVVSYNGKCYDIPLLDSRNITHRIESSLTELKHLDLLHAVRRVWKTHLPDCSLGTTENRLLGLQRVGDIPGYLIPHMYFNYLQNGNAKLLRPIFHHNHHDILTMAALLAKLMDMFESPLQTCCHCEEILAIGKVLEDLKEYREALTLYQEALAHSIGKKYKRELYFRIALIWKRIDEWENAKRAWQQARKESFHPLSYIELAKHYEHRERDLSKAMSFVEKALTQLEPVVELGKSARWAEEINDLRKRKDRLRRKLRSVSL